MGISDLILSSRASTALKRARLELMAADDDADVVFQCNICGAPCRSRAGDLTREAPSCRNCGSTVRMRSVIHLLSLELFGRSIPLRDFPVRKEVIGIGMSDWDGYAVSLADKLGYTNTFYHKEPRLDITSVGAGLYDKYDFIVSTDVFEHVSPPVSPAFKNLQRLLKKGGVLIFSVPYISAPDRGTVEHFPGLHEYRIVDGENGKILENTTREGVRETYRDLVFHGGEGDTLEMRSFSEPSLWDELRRAGFESIEKHDEPYLKYGIIWKDEHTTHCSPPIAVRKRRKHMLSRNMMIWTLRLFNRIY